MASKIVYHIVSRREWEQAQAAGLYRTATLNSEGFIHCSTSKQVVGVANRWYRGQRGLVLLCIDRKKVSSPVKFEPPTHPGDDSEGPSVLDTLELFPHIYGPVNLDAIVQVIDFPPGANGHFTLPDAVWQVES